MDEDREGPRELNDVSASARWRWYALADQLPEKRLYRPASLSQVAQELELHRPMETKAEQVVVRPGDDLGKLAAKHLGSADRRLEIFEANRDLIDDPREIHPGWSVRLP